MKKQVGKECDLLEERLLIKKHTCGCLLKRCFNYHKNVTIGVFATGMRQCGPRTWSAGKTLTSSFILLLNLRDPFKFLIQVVDPRDEGHEAENPRNISNLIETRVP